MLRYLGSARLSPHALLRGLLGRRRLVVAPRVYFIAAPVATT